MDYKFEDVLKTIRTTSEKKELLSWIDSLNADIFRGDLFSQELNKQGKNQFVKDLILNFQLNAIDTNDKDSLESYFRELRAKIAAVKIVDVIIAVEPTESIKLLIKGWMENIFSDQVIFDLTIDDRIIGGAIIIYEGQYFDFSLVEKLNQLFNGDRTKISTLMTHESL